MHLNTQIKFSKITSCRPEPSGRSLPGGPRAVGSRWVGRPDRGPPQPRLEYNINMTHKLHYLLQNAKPISRTQLSLPKEGHEARRWTVINRTSGLSNLWRSLREEKKP